MKRKLYKFEMHVSLDPAKVEDFLALLVELVERFGGALGGGLVEVPDEVPHESQDA